MEVLTPGPAAAKLHVVMEPGDSLIFKTYTSTVYE